ncbi:MAG: hypothetical protein Sapg2KO_49080 [Saprospiraceae bacterium]
MRSQEIPVEILNISLFEDAPQRIESILENEIKGIHIEHIAIQAEKQVVDYAKKGYKTIYLFVKGSGSLLAENKNYELIPETIFLPNQLESIRIKANLEEPLHYLKISSELTAQDLLDLEGFPSENTQKAYYAKFSDCKPYTEPIKSPNTVSRTILPNKIIPRIAMGTVQTVGPDEVGAHEHPMLEQLFLGLEKNNCVVHADGAKVTFPQHALLHIPLGSRHGVSVEKGEAMYYVWMDFFLDKKGEEWLKTHLEAD